MVYNIIQKVVITIMWLPANIYVLKETWTTSVLTLIFICILTSLGLMVLMDILDEHYYSN